MGTTRRTIHWVLIAGFVMFTVGRAAEAVGTMPELQVEPFGWDWPWRVFACLISLIAIGYIAGRWDEQAAQKGG